LPSLPTCPSFTSPKMTNVPILAPKHAQWALPNAHPLPTQGY
jgi:hypothetical protein